MSVLLSYEELRDSINNRVSEIENRLNDMPVEELRGLMRDLLTERRLVIEEIDELRETRYWNLHRHYPVSRSMKLMISNLDEETYNLLQAKASRLGIDSGILLNELMHQVSEKTLDGNLPDLTSKDLQHLRKDKDYAQIKHISNIQVTSKDLEDVHYKIKFSHIKHVEFDKEMDVTLFNDKIKSINHCGTVVFPHGFSKLLAYAKAGYCKELVFP